MIEMLDTVVSCGAIALFVVFLVSQALIMLDNAFDHISDREK